MQTYHQYVCIIFCITFYTTRVFMLSKTKHLLATLMLIVTSTSTASSTVFNNFIKHNIDIIKAMIQEPQKVSAFAASSPWTVDELTRFITPSTRQRILELGFGPGNVTRQILSTKNAKSRFDGLEILPEFFDTTKSDLISENLLDSESFLHLTSADSWEPSDYKNKPQYDLVISTIPFIRLPNDVVEGIIKNTAKHLKPGGTFSFITYCFSRSLGHCKISSDDRLEYLEKLELFDSLLNEYFEEEHKEELVLRNLPPTYVYHYTRK